MYTGDDSCAWAMMANAITDIDYWLGLDLGGTTINAGLVCDEKFARPYVLCALTLPLPVQVWRTELLGRSSSLN